MKAWLLFALGTLAYFLIRYIKRTDPKPGFDLGFWLKDNWAQLLAAFCLDLILMVLLMDPLTDITPFLLKFLPEGVVITAKLVSAPMCGLGLGWAAYEYLKDKLPKTVKPN